MSLPRPVLLVSLSVLFALGGSLALAASARTRGGKPIVPPRFQQVRVKVDALFGRRSTPPPPPEPRFNPFRVAGATLPAAPRESGAPVAEPLTADPTVLQQAAATLKVGGVFQINGEFRLIINGRQYGKTDSVQTQVQGQPVFLRIVEITRHSLTLALEGAEMTLKF